jgi:hypothetical protein
MNSITVSRRVALPGSLVAIALTLTACTGARSAAPTSSPAPRSSLPTVSHVTLWPVQPRHEPPADWPDTFGESAVFVDPILQPGAFPGPAPDPSWRRVDDDMARAAGWPRGCRYSTGTDTQWLICPDGRWSSS